MKYYNQNPQVAALLEKIEEQEKQLKFAYDYNEIIVKSYNDLTEAVELFNKMPWYKKMFYKFKIWKK